MNKKIRRPDWENLGSVPAIRPHPRPTCGGRPTKKSDTRGTGPGKRKSRRSRGRGSASTEKNKSAIAMGLQDQQNRCSAPTDPDVGRPTPKAQQAHENRTQNLETSHQPTTANRACKGRPAPWGKMPRPSHIRKTGAKEGFDGNPQSRSTGRQGVAEKESRWV